MPHAELCEHWGSTWKWLEDWGGGVWFTKSPQRNMMHFSSTNLIDYLEEKLHNLVQILNCIKAYANICGENPYEFSR